MFTHEPTHDDIIRLVCLDIINHALNHHGLNQESYMLVRDTLMNYIRAFYSGGQGRSDSAAIQNKLTQTITYLFTSMYAVGWESIFQDFGIITRNDATKDTGNIPGNIFYLRVLSSIHDEIADQLLFRSSDDQKKNTDLRDLIRERDMKAIANYWQMLLSKWQQTDLLVVEMCLKNVSRWVSWIEISLIVNDFMIGRLLEIAGQQNVTATDSPEGRARDSAIDTFTEIVGKKMKPADKIELIRSLQLSDIVSRLISSPALSDLRYTSNYDTDFAETVAKLVNNVVYDIVNALNTSPTDRDMSQKAEELLEQFIPHMLRFFTDQYDEICCTIIASLTELLTFFRKSVKSKAQLPQLYASFILPILQAVILKMKYDETSSWGEGDDQTDEAEFQDLRKRLYVLQQIIAAIDESLFLSTLADLIAGTMNSLKVGRDSVDWRDVELALYELHLIGDLGLKSGSLYQKGSHYNTASVTITRLLIEVLSCGKRCRCYSCWEDLLTHVGNNIALHPHPSVQIRFMEVAVRYHSFFDKQPDFIPQVLDGFVNLAHSGHTKVRYQAWNLMLRFIKSVKSHMAPYSKQAVQALLDLLVISAELKLVNEDESDGGETRDVRFNSQIYLFEGIGCMISVLPDVSEQKAIIGPVTDLLKPVYASAIGPATERNPQAILQMHHVITAWATLARGTSDWTPNSSLTPPSEELAIAFVDAMECTLRALEIPRLNEQEDIRNAARFAFPRLLGVLGSRMLPQLPRWIEGLLSKNSTKDEMSSFLRILEQVVFGFKGDIYPVMDRFLQPLLERLLGAINMPIEGTDDEVFLAELRREYLNFLLIMLNNGLESVFTSDGRLRMKSSSGVAQADKV